MPSSSCTRKWQEHQGRNVFLCNGRFISSQQNVLFLFTFSLLLLVICLFSIFSLPFLTLRIGIFVPIFMIILFMFVISTMLRAVFTDPGIIPRASSAEIVEYRRMRKKAKTQEEKKCLKERVINIDGCDLTLNYCTTCRIFRPPRASHCRVCDNCVLNFDHHCPWIGTCVGARNYRFFYLFIVFVAIADFFSVICICFQFYLVMVEKDGSFLDSLFEIPVSVVLVLPFIASFIAVMFMIFEQTPMVLKGITGHEDYKSTFIRSKNPFDEGSSFKNLKKALCSPGPPSLMDRRGRVLPGEPYICIDYRILEKVSKIKQTTKV